MRNVNLGRFDPDNVPRTGVPPRRRNGGVVFRRHVSGSPANAACADMSPRGIRSVSSRTLRIDFGGMRVYAVCGVKESLKFPLLCRGGWGAPMGGPEGLIYASRLLVSLLRARAASPIAGVDLRNF